MTFHPVVVLGPEHDILFKSTATYCVPKTKIRHCTVHFFSIDILMPREGSSNTNLNIFSGIQQKVSKRGPFFRRLIDFCYRYKSAYRRRGMPTPILDFLIFKKMRAIVGGKIRLLLSGGAPLSPDTHDFVRCALDLPLVQVILKAIKIQQIVILPD